MERRRRSRGGARRGARPPEGPGPQLWLFPSASGLHDALWRRCEATRQMSCTRERLVVLARGGAGVEVHQLAAMAGSDGARKPSEWGRAGGGWRVGGPAHTLRRQPEVPSGRANRKCLRRGVGGRDSPRAVGLINRKCRPGAPTGSALPSRLPWPFSRDT